jgi:hypothetical protein
LLAFDDVTLGHEVAEGAEGDHVLREQRTAGGEIDGVDAVLQALEPAPHRFEVVRVGFAPHYHRRTFACSMGPRS